MQQQQKSSTEKLVTESRKKSSAIVHPEVEQQRMQSSTSKKRSEDSPGNLDLKEQRQIQMLRMYHQDEDLHVPSQGSSPSKSGSSIRDRWKSKMAMVSIKSEKLSQESQERTQPKPQAMNVLKFGDQMDSMIPNNVLSPSSKWMIGSMLQSCTHDLYTWFYFASGVLSYLTDYAPKSGTWFIFGFVIAFGVNFLHNLKYHRQLHQRMKDVDQQLVSAYNPLQKEFLPIDCGQLQVGSIVKLKQGDILPADCILFATSGPELEVSFNELPNEGSRLNVQLARIANFDPYQISNLGGSLEFDEPVPFAKGKPAKIQYNHNNVPNETPIQAQKSDVLLRGWQSTHEHEVFLVAIRVGYRCKYLRHGYRDIQSHARPNREFLKQTFRIQALMILIGISLAVLMGGLQIYLRDTKFGSLQYLSGTRTQTLSKAVSQYFIIFTSIVPILQWPFYHVLLALQSIKIARATELDPQIRGAKAQVNNPSTLYWLPTAKYVNVSAEALYREAITVSKGMICRQVFDEMEYEHRTTLVELEEQMHEKEGFELEEIQQAFEAGLLSLGIDERSVLDVGLQNYFLQMNMIHYTRGRSSQRLVQMPDENFKYYKQVLQLCGQDYTYQIMIYEIPFDKKQLKKIRKTNRSFKPEPSYLIVYRCTFDQAKMFLDNGFISQVPTQSVNIDNFHVISKKSMSLSEFRSFLTHFSPDALKQFLIVEDFSVEFLNLIHERLTPMLALETQKAVAHSLLPLVDLSRADIKTWIFSDARDLGSLDYDANYNELKIYFCCFEIFGASSENQLQDSLDRVHTLLNLPFEDTTDPCATIALVNQRKFLLLVDQQTCQVAFASSALSNRFKRLLLMPQFVYFLGCKQSMRRQLVLVQDEYRVLAVSVLNGMSDTVLCQQHTFNVALNQQQSAWSDFVVPTIGSLPILLFNHSRLTNMRISQFILYLTYAAIALTTAEVVYAPFNGFSGDMLYGSTLHFLYTYLFVALYGATLFTFKTDIQTRFFRKHAHLMELTRKNYNFNFVRVLQSVVWGVYHGVICTFIPILVLDGCNDISGTVQGHYLTSMSSYILLLVIITSKPLFNLEVIQLTQVIAYFINFGFFMLIISQVCQSMFTRLYEPSLIYSFQAMFQITKVFCAIMFVPIGILLPNLMILYNFKLFGKHPLTKAMKKTEKELDEEHSRYLDRQARNIINEEEEELQEKQNNSVIFDEKLGDPQPGEAKPKDL